MRATSGAMVDYRAILFDLDGVLADTMADNYAAWCQAFAPIGIKLEREEYYLLEGLNADGVTKVILERRQRNPAMGPEIARSKESYYRQQARCSLFPGALHMLDSLAARVRLGLVSGASRSRMTGSLPPRFMRFFAAVVCGDDVRQPKPHPEPYRKAAAAIDLTPGNCLAVENAPLGIEAAKRAGMDCIAVCSTLERHHLSGADLIADNIAALYALLIRMEFENNHALPHI